MTKSSVLPRSAMASRGGRRAIIARPASSDATGCCSRCSCAPGRGGGGDDPQLRVGGGDPCFGGLDRLGRGGLLRAAAAQPRLWRRRRSARAAWSRLRAARLLGARLLQRGIERLAPAAARARSPRAAAAQGQARAQGASRANLRDDRGGSQGSMSPGTIARRASRGPAGAARSLGRTRGAGRRDCRCSSSNGRRRRRSGSAPRACRRRAMLELFRQVDRRQAPCRVRRAGW